MRSGQKIVHYRLRCLECGREYQDTNFRLRCDADHAPAFLRAVYSSPQLTIDKNAPGIFRYSRWLPVGQPLKKSGTTITYRSEELARKLGLNNLYINFNGYWPEKGASMITCSFKELEAFPVLSRLQKSGKSNIVVASAGNTGRAFAYACSLNSIPLHLVVPESGLPMIWLADKPDSCVNLIALRGGDYLDAINLAARIAQKPGFTSEGGALNVARRDGMGTAILNGVLSIGSIPDHYFQAIGSGTGAIAAWEANIRLAEDGRFGDRGKLMNLHLAQNVPFTPIIKSWRSGNRDFVTLNEDESKKELEKVYAKVLSNRNPPYSIKGGVYDAMSDAGGDMYEVTNKEALMAQEDFERLEGIDISPAAAVAVGALYQAVKQNKIAHKDVILLNITGGGYKRLRKDYSLHQIQPLIEVDGLRTDLNSVMKVLV